MFKCLSPLKIFRRSTSAGRSGAGGGIATDLGPDFDNGLGFGGTAPPAVPVAEVEENMARREAEELETAIAISLCEATNTAIAGGGAPATHTGFVADPAPVAQPPEAPVTPPCPRQGEAAAGPGGDADPTEAAEKEALCQLDEILANCEATGGQFIDPAFRPSPEALYANGRCRRRDAQRLACVQHFGTADLERIDWKSAGQILQRPDDMQMEFDSPQEMMATVHQFARCVEWRVFQNDPSATDISQGGLGNCWFCGSLAAVAEKPSLIRRLFIDPCSKSGDLSPKGVYLIRLCDGGRWNFSIIDGLLPVNRHSMLAFSGARRNQLWVPLLEKAYSKLRGHYEAIEGGTPAEGLRLFTGWPSIVQELQPVRDQEEADGQHALRTQAVCPYAGEDLLWTRLQSAYESRLIICGSCGHVEGITDEQYRGVGLSPSHCYSIVQASAALHGTLRLLKLRNPWGTGRKWTGKFSDKDNESWTPEIREEVSAHDLGAEGLFWMTLQDIRKYFTSITICPYRQGWAEERRLAEFPVSTACGTQPAFLLRSAVAVEALLSLMQPEERASPTMMSADFGLAIFRMSRDAPAATSGASLENLRGLTLVDTVKRRVQDTLICDFFMPSQAGEEPAPVLVVPLSFNQRATVQGGGCDKPFTFAGFFAHPVRVRAVSLSAEAHRDALAAHVRRVGARTRLFENVHVYQATDAGLAVMVENASMDSLLFETRLSEIFNMTVSRGMEASATGEQQLRSRDTVPPMHAMIVLVAAAMPAGHNYCFNSKCSVVRYGSGNVHEPSLEEPFDALHTPFFLEAAAAASTALPVGRFSANLRMW